MYAKPYNKIVQFGCLDDAWLTTPSFNNNIKQSP